MRGNFFKGVLLGSVTAVLVLSATAALAGTGVGGVFNLGKSNTVNGATSLSGATSGTQLTVGNTSTAAAAHTLQVNGASAGAAFVARNTAGPAASFVSPSNKAPFLVSNSQKVAGLNADKLDGLSSTAFLSATGTAVNSGKLGGNLPSFYLSTTGIAADSALFGGFGTDHFLAASATAANSALLGGFSAVTFFASRGEPVGNTVTTVDNSADVGQFASVTIGSDGLPVASYFDNTNSALVVVHCGTIDCSSGNTSTTEDNVAVQGYTSIAIGSDGFPVVSYQGGTRLKILHCGNVACTAGGLLTILDTNSSSGYYSSVAIGTDGFPVVSYYDASNQDLRVAHCGDVMCSSGNTTNPVDTTGNVGSHTSIAIGADGLPVISYYDATNGGLKVAHCGSVDCSSGDATQTVDTGSFVGVNNSIAIGVDGLPLISYRDPANFTLKFAHCGSLDCTTGNTLTDVAVDDIVGVYGSLTIGADGLPVASHWDQSSSSLVVTHCGNVACSAGDATATVAAIGANNTSERTAITVGVDGLPLIAYYNVTDQAFKVAHCANAFCVPYFRRR